MKLASVFELSIVKYDHRKSLHHFPLSVLYNDTNFMEVLNETLPQFDQWNVTTDQLRQKLGFELKEMLNFKVTFGDSKTRISLNNTLTAAIFGSAVSGWLVYTELTHLHLGVI
jgi:hypothetical protein